MQDEGYFRREVEPNLDGDRVHSVAEAMACGTPVIAHARGSMPELVEDGVTGFVVDDVAGAVAAVAGVASLDRRVIRDRAVTRFGRDRMIAAYEAVYRRVLGG